MNTSILTCGLLFFSFCLNAAGAGVSGRVLLRGTPPPERVIEMTADCAAAQERPPTTRHYTVDRDGGLANVFVVIRSGLKGKTFTPPTTAVSMECVACQIQPYVVAVQTGQTIRFHNNSSFLENLHFTPKLNRERNFALGLKRTSLATTFDLPEDFIPIKGDAHPWFFGYVCVVDHPFFAVTGADGRFQFPNGLPDGSYTLEALHLKAGSAKKEIVVRAGRNDPIAFALEVPVRK